MLSKLKYFFLAVVIIAGIAYTMERKREKRIAAIRTAAIDAFKAQTINLGNIDVKSVAPPEMPAMTEILSLQAKAEAPDSTSETWLLLAGAQLRLARKTGDRKLYDAAEQSAATCISKGESYPARVMIANIKFTRQDSTGALGDLEALISVKSDFLPALISKAGILMQLGRYPDALATAERTMAPRPLAAGVQIHAMIQEAMGRLTGAEADFKKAIDLEDRFDFNQAITDRLEFARAEMYAGRTGAARELLQSALRTNVKEPRLYALKGRLDLLEGRWIDADRSFSAAYEASHDPLYVVDRVIVKRAQPQSPEVEVKKLAAMAVGLARIDTGLRSAPHEFVLAKALLLESEPAGLIEADELMTALLNRRRDLDTLALALRVALARNETQKATSLANELVATGTKRPVYLALAANAAKAAGDNAKAESASTQVLALDPRAFDRIQLF